MIRTSTPRLIAALVAACGLAGSASADTLLTDFGNVTLNPIIGSWPSGTVVTGPTSVRAQATGFGGGLIDLNPNVNAAGDTEIAFDITVHAADPVTGLGAVLPLVDEDGTTVVFTWFGLQPGDHLLTTTITNPDLDLSDLSFVWIQVDPGTSQVPYDIEFNNLTLTPEPASLGLLGAGLAVALGRRRRA